MPTALAESCDTYFYRLGQRFYSLPSDRGHPLQAWANRFGIGEKTGIDIGPEAQGLIATPEYLDQLYPASKGYSELQRTWKPGYSIQMAIGQNQVLVTPLQMARLYAMIANGGKLVTPHLAEDVELTGTSNQPSRVLRRFGAVSPEADRRRPDGAHAGCSAGSKRERTRPSAPPTASSATSRSTSPARREAPRSSSRSPATSTRENLTQSWWCGYGPYDSPSIVVCAVIENGGHGGTAAAPAALKVFEQYFHKTAQTTAHPSD